MIHQEMCRSPKQVSISLWNVAGAFANPNGIWSLSQNPRGPTVNAVNFLLSSSIFTCQYPVFKSREVKIWAPFKQSSVSSMYGRLYASLLVHEFSLCRSIQNLKLPSFFHTSTTVLPKGYWISLWLPRPTFPVGVSLLLQTDGGYLVVPFFKWSFIH